MELEDHPEEEEVALDNPEVVVVEELGQHQEEVVEGELLQKVEVAAVEEAHHLPLLPSSPHHLHGDRRSQYHR